MNEDIQRRHSKWYELVLFNRWVQWLVGLLVVVVAPAWIMNKFYWPMGEVIFNSLLANGSAFLISSYFLNKLRRFPGVQSFYMTLPTVAASWLLAFAVLFFTREPYSRPILLLAYGFASCWALAGYYLGRRHNYRKLALVPFGRAKPMASTKEAAVYTLHEPSLNGRRFDGIVVDLRADDLPPEWERFLAQCVLANMPVYHYKQISESMTGRVNIEHMSENVFGDLQPSSTYAFLKRFLETILVLVTLPIWLPVMLLTGLAVKFDSKGPMFFVQERVGQKGVPYRVYKLRSMTTDSEKDGAQFAASNDARITRFGHFIRKTRLDEFPQFINVLKGDMSLIGPRPEQKQFVKQFEQEIPFYSYRHIVKPGITGWAQVMQGYAADTEDTRVKVEYDFYYIKHFSIWLDVLIVLKTIKTILTGFGAR